ncbi:MAG: hypothetical protein QOG44_2234 [Acidimicrobiaceae bacterium]|jgi:hypothetical protein|nr:hypothetical protein [Acidimicrobiaceae bacterium]
MLVVKRAALMLAMVLGVVLVQAQPASAHSVSGVGATNWKSVLTSVSPSVPGLTVKLVEGGSRIEVVNHGPEILVVGYEGEPYLRVGPQGVFENLQSPATYLNCSRAGCSFPAGINKDGPPKWKKISSGQTARWHDHRAHFMGTQLPPDVAQAPNKVHQEANWEIAMTQGSTPITVKGNYTWIPGSSPLPWLLVALALAAVGAALGLLGAWGVPLAVALVVVTVNDIYHAVGIAWFWSGGFVYRLEKFFSGSFYSFVGWALGFVAVWLLVRRRVDGLYAAVFAGGSAALFTGLLDITVLSRSQAPFGGSLVVDRVTVVISLGLGLGVAVGALIGIRASRPELELDDADDFDDDVDGEVDEVNEVNEVNDRDGDADDRDEDADGAVRSLGDAAADAELPGRG